MDIFVAAILLYTATAFLKQTRAEFIIRGIFNLAVIYIVARYFDLQLTAWIFHGFFAIFLIIMVVIFQEEFRQIFERSFAVSEKRGQVSIARDNRLHQVDNALELGSLLHHFFLREKYPSSKHRGFSFSLVRETGSENS